MWQGLINKYRDFLPVTEATPIVTLNEGNTPLVYSENLSRIVSAEVYPHAKNFAVGVYLKYEGLNPTGSFKDRGMTMAISKAKEDKSTAVICASTGNTSASASAYAARAGLKSIVLVPEGAVALGKLSQALIHGAVVLQIRGNFDDALNLVKEISAKYPVTLVNSLNPFRIEGQKTGAFEICDQLEEAPHFQLMPVGNAGNITAYWKGYKEYKEKNKINKLPRMLGFQAQGAAPIVRGEIVKNPKTVATAIRIGNPASWKNAEAARDESGGLIDMVSDEEILNAYKMLAAGEGIFVEPASAASVAGLLKLVKNDYFKRDSQDVIGNAKIVCVLTGHGLKDPDRALAIIKKPKIIKPDIKAVLKEIGY